MKNKALRVAIQNSTIWGYTGENDFMVDSREMQFSKTGLRDAAAALCEIISDLEFDAIASSGVGGMPLASALKLLLLEHIKLLCIRSERKGYDLNKLVEGPGLADGDRVLIIDDLINKGATFNRLSDALIEEFPNCKIIGMAVLVDYEKLGSKQLRVRALELRSVFTFRDLNLRKKSASRLGLRCTRKWQNLSIGTTENQYTRSIPVITGDKLIVGTDYTGWVCCDKSTGEVVWEVVSRLPRPKPVASAAQIFNGSVILSAYDGIIRSVDVDTGRINWQNKVDSFVHSTAQIHDRRIYIGTEGRRRKGQFGDIVCLDAVTSKEYWRVKTRDQVPCTPLVISEHQMVICASNDKVLYSVQFDGGLIWTKNTGELIKGKPCYANDRIFTASNSGHIDCWDLTGTRVWSRQIGKSMWRDWPTIHDGMVIVSLAENAIASLDQETGDVIWYTRVDSRPAYSMAVHEKTGFLITRKGVVYQIDLSNGKVAWAEQVVEDCQIEQPVVLDLPSFYVCTDRWGLIAFDLKE